LTSTPRVSVVVPAYNAQRYLDATLRSVLGQSERSLELIVVDDCSRDGTAEVVRAAARADARVRLLTMPANSGGPAGPRNMGIASARADWVALCDADDLWHPQKLERQLAFAEARPATLVCTSIRDFAEDEPPFGRLAGPPAAAESISLQRILMKNCIATSSVLVRRDAVQAAGGFDTARSLVAVEDYDLWVRLLEGGSRLLRLPEPLVHYRRVAASLSASKFGMLRKVLRVLARHFERIGRRWMFPIAVPWLMTTYATYSVVLRVWRGRL
jgi:teichuronic acid biosynthesis glycosyltransferase TuaG